MATKDLQTLNLKFNQVMFYSLVFTWEKFEVTFGIFSVLVSQRKLFRYLSVLKLIMIKNVKTVIISAFKVTPTTFYEISKISHICSIFRKSVCIRVVRIFWHRAGFVFPLFPRKGGQNSENL